MAWMLLSNASVLSVEDGILTLRFPRDGDLKGFSVSGHDAVLKRVLSTGFGLNVTIKGVAGGDPGRSGGGPAPARGREGPPRVPAARSHPARAPPRVRVRSPGPAAPPEFAAPDFGGPYDEPDDMPPDELPPDEPVTGRPGGPERRTDRHGPHPA